MTLRTSPLVLAVALGLLNPAALDVEEPSAVDRARAQGDDGGRPEDGVVDLEVDVTAGD